MVTIKNRLKKVEERIKEICIDENHSKYKSNNCPYCDEWEKLVLERNKLFDKIFYGK
jgi:hypothetical protein